MNDELLARTGLTKDEMKAALLDSLNSRATKGDCFRQMGGMVYHYRDGAIIKAYGEVDEDLNLLALVTGAMTQNERWNYVDKLALLKPEIESSQNFVALADAPTRAVAAYTALGLGKEVEG